MLYLLIFCKNGQFNIEDVFPYADNEPFIKQSLEEWFDMIVNDKELRKTISENQRKRLEDFTYDRITQRLWDWLVKYDHPESK